MNIILCHPQDRDAIWLHMELKQKQVPVHLLAPEQLLMADEWTQYIDTDSDSYRVKTKSGITLDNTERHFLFNRIQLAQSPIWNKAEETEKNYVQAELNAALMSLLYSMQRKSTILNPVVGYSLSGVYWSKDQWTKAAYEAGFEDVAITEESAIPYHSILVVDDKVIPNNTDEEVIEQALSLSKLAQTPLLEITFSRDGKQLTGANSFPALKKYGKELVDIIQQKML